MVRALGQDRTVDDADDAVLRRYPAVREGHGVAHGLAGDGRDDDLVGGGGFATLAQDESGQGRRGPRVRLDGCRILCRDERDRDVGDDALDAGDRGDLLRGIRGKRGALAQRSGMSSGTSTYCGEPTTTSTWV